MPHDTDPAASQDRLNRIQAIGAKAESLLAQDPDSPEGLAFQSQYLKLLSRYQLEPDELGRAATAAGDVTATRYTIPGGPWADKRERLVSIVLGIFKVPHVLVKIQDKRTVLMASLPTTIEVVCRLNDHLLPQLDLMVIRAKADPGYLQEASTGRRLFVSGALDSWTMTVTQRLADLYAEAEHETPASATGKDLAVVDKAQQVMQEVKQLAMELHGARNRRAMAAPGYHHERARQIGREAADRADIGQTATGTGSGPLAVES